MAHGESWASSPGRRRNMQANRSRNTKPELAVRRILHAEGFRYRVNYRPVPHFRRTADIVFTRHQLAVFIDGCYWHVCPEHGSQPSVNTDYWTPKLQRNRERDRETVVRLEAEGWRVLRFWEHSAPEEVANAIIAAYRARPQVGGE
jgi:DNA mismatch endonuclease (patch repair protein)